MYSKKGTQELIDRYGPEFIEGLGLKSWKINFHVYRRGSKKLKQLKVSKNFLWHTYGLSFMSIKTKAADIVIYYNMHGSRNQCLATILHELLHLRLHALTSLITIKQGAGDREDEKTIRILEKFIMRYINGRK